MLRLLTLFAISHVAKLYQSSQNPEVAESAPGSFLLRMLQIDSEFLHFPYAADR